MNTHFIDSLDGALERVGQGEGITAVLLDYPAQSEDLAPLLKSADLLNGCKPVVMPPSEELLVDRQQFLDQMAQLLPPAVSSSPVVRLNSWMSHMLSWLRLNPDRKKREQKNMGTLILKATLILSIIFGSAGGTAVMAAESLPDSPLYPAKLMFEEARLNLASDQVAQAQIHLDIASTRLREIERLMIDSNMVEGALLERAENHLELAFDLAADMPVQQMTGILEQAQDMVQTRTRAFADIEAEIPLETEPAFVQVRKMLQNAGETTAAGLQDPQSFRHRHAVNRPETAPKQPEMMPRPVITATQPITPPVRVEPTRSCVNNETCEPQGEGPYGPAYEGPKIGEPGEGAGLGEPNGESNGASNQGVPPEKSGSDGEQGNPDNGCADCAQGNQNQYGPQPEDSGNGAGKPSGSEDSLPNGGQSQSQNGNQHQAPDNTSSSTDSGAQSSANSNNNGNGNKNN